MTTESVTGIMPPMAAREQLRIDTSRQLRNKLKSIAYDEDKSLRELVLRAIAKAYPQTKELVEKDLK